MIFPNSLQQHCATPKLEEAAELYTPAAANVFLGRGGGPDTALEGALKLKEIAYVTPLVTPLVNLSMGQLPSSLTSFRLSLCVRKMACA